ncbi:MAG TPA: caspase family protein [Kofleriaceae bacterium]|nr:caspase family protein [Kofleriaceae bacterium]
MRTAAILGVLAAACGGRARPKPSAADDVCGPALPDPASSAAPRQVVQRRHASAITSLAWSDDGAYLATASPDGARVWEIASHALVRSLVRGAGAGRPATVTWDAEGHLVYGVEDAIVVDVADDRDVGRFGWELEALNGSKYQAEVRTPVRVRGGRALAWVAEAQSNLYTFDAKRAKQGRLQVPPGVYGYVGHLAAAADGSAVVSASDSTAYVWRVGTALGAPVEVAVGQVVGLELFPGGERLLVGARAALNDMKGASSVAIVPVGGGAATTLPDAGGWVRDVALSTDGALAAAAGGEKLVVWDVATARVLWSRPARYDGDIDASYTKLAFSPDGARLAVVTLGGDISVLDARSGRRQASLGVDVRVPYHAVFTGEDTLVVASAAHVTTWSLHDGRRLDDRSFRLEDLLTLATLGGDVVSLRSMPLVDTIASLDGSCDDQDGPPLYIDRWRGATPPDTLPDHESLDHELALEAPAWPPAAGLARRARCLPGAISLLDIAPTRGLALLATDGAPVVLDLASGKATPIALEAGLFVPGYGLSPDGRFVIGVSGVGFGSAHVWDAATGAEVARVQVEIAGNGTQFAGAHQAAVSPDGTTLAVSFGEVVELHALPTGGRRARATASGRITAMRFAPGGVLHVGTADGTLAAVRADGQALPLGSTGGGAIRSIAISPSGTRVATLDEDGAVRIWNPTARAVAAALLDFGDDEWAALTPGGGYAGTAEASEHVGWVFADPLEHFRFEQFAAYRDASLVARRLGDGTSDVPRAVRRPPSLHLTARTTGARARLEATFASKTRVDRVRFFVEGRPVADRVVCRATGTATAEVPLHTGANRVTAVAFDDRGFASNPVTADLSSSAATARPALHVVAVGVSAYPHLAAKWQLQAADDDARALTAALAAHAGPGKEYARAHTTLLLDDRVTVASVRAALRGLAAMKPDDVAVVFLAGHGFKQSADGDMVFVTGALRDLAHPASAGIAWRDIADLLAAAPGRVLVLLDACHAGHVSRELVVPNNALASSLARQGRAGVVVFAASKGRQLSYETTGARALRYVRGERTRPAARPGAQHGIFTRALLDALDAAATDRDLDGAIQLSELLDATTASVIETTEGLQTPWVARREIFGDWSVAAARR